ncbi:hypothetical protein H6S82_07890 [Planktothrix sp. FACHB-1355]|uniref:Uncharacterized protein n=1 Tax=Aerosakkonema funiforme FACHB-1375 TaxID=2949571 RepID=A0A926VF94_9CYAN|nr:MULTISPECIES: hypothetical protein [Oscillatoriales]MBD2181454.1 hypothetical protein [Aerosakkonema funiforme FACHB-1375]MBD3558776.1 hypothetical protein [Planktothrix sp. FACHB-1355]
MSQVSVKKFTPIVLGLLAGTTVVPFAFPQTTLAQTLDRDPSQDFQRQEDNSSFYGGGTGQGFSVFDLIHRANLGQNRSPEEFSTEQRQSLDDAAEQFRAKQREQLQIPQNQAVPGNSAAPVTTPPTQSN